MVIWHTRTQHPVGQGFFHSAECRDTPSGSIQLRYVYDCGSKQTFSTSRDAAIDAFLADPAPLDILFLSHAHDDHVLGVPRLIDGRPPKTVVMPFLTPEERLLAFVSSAMDDITVVNDPFYVSFTVDPAQALFDLGAQDVIQIRRGSGNAPGADGEEPRPSPPTEGAGKDTPPDPDRNWTIVGDTKGKRVVAKPPHSARRTLTTLPDTCAIAVSPGISGSKWMLGPYVDPGIVAQRSEFAKAFATITGLNIWRLRYPKPLRDIIANRLPDLQRAYRSVAGDLNLTSLCLFSGPMPPHDSVGVRYVGIGDKPTWFRLSHERIGWLATGDAELRSTKRRKNFLDHYGALLKRVCTLTLPHHGSVENFDPELLDHIQPLFCVASAARYNTWQHPGTYVVQDVASAGIPLTVVTSDGRSILTEVVVTGLK
ncbi:MBL fold metallo-hydrolase [Bosea sp. (in: a-proteobacteria)]|uniref:MBL fold metallo-hydrolase n=1 Tax=Bosea sp. (in: a-proteobacteria) TaxID=1871050 RepID=UPI002735642B|nr:MBL fold metallo-hydrolase [Bosea sp. (in: a-proteobacteria)]MDP3410356.1 MBL fold metallo-hydrolase [Bosea sp. (in: a-proteobacteria)]